MADRRRRKNVITETESEEDTKVEQRRNAKPSECESEGDTREGNNSEYESADEGHKDEEEDDSEEEEESEEESDEDDDETYDGEDESVIVEDDDLDEERQSGDGEEQPETGEHVDDDEDKKNPAYVPKRGAFYEHDMRISMDDQAEEDKKPKKKLWKDEGKWLHDRYQPDQQAPKSRAELYNTYGYDITLSDKPPEAPPRNNRPRGPRSQQKQSLKDFISDDDYVRSRNSYNSLKSRGNNRDYDQGQRRGKRGFPRRGDNFRRGDFRGYRDDHGYEERSRGYNRSNRNDYRENYQNYRAKSEPLFQGRDQNQEYWKDQGEDNRIVDDNFREDRGSSQYDKHSYRDSRSSEKENRSYNRDNVEKENYSYKDLVDKENRSYRDNRKNNDQDSLRENRGGFGQERNPSKEMRDQEQASHHRSVSEENSYGDNRESDHRRGRGYRGGRGSRRPGNRKFNSDYQEQERNFPPRFQRAKQNMQSENEYTSQGPVGEDDVYKSSPQSQQNYKTSFPPPPPSEPQPAPIVESVIVQNVGERKSYSKERRVKSSGTRAQDEPVAPSPTTVMEEPPANTDVPEDTSVQPQQLENKGYSKQQDQQGKPKRYSSQRQRNMQEVAYAEPVDNQKYYPQAANQAPPYPAHPTQAILRPPIATVSFPMTGVPSGAMSTPQHIFPPGSQPPSSTQVQMIAPQFTNTGVIYGAAPNFPVAPVPLAGFPAPGNHPPPPLASHQQGFPSPPANHPPPNLAAQQSPSQSNQQELYRGQTVYFPPELQMPRIMNRSPPKRTKAAIPIVNPKEVRGQSTKSQPIEEGDVLPEEYSEETKEKQQYLDEPDITSSNQHSESEITISNPQPGKHSGEKMTQDLSQEGATRQGDLNRETNYLHPTVTDKQQDLTDKQSLNEEIQSSIPLENPNPEKGVSNTTETVSQCVHENSEQIKMQGSSEVKNETKEEELSSSNSEQGGLPYSDVSSTASVTTEKSSGICEGKKDDCELRDLARKGEKEESDSEIFSDAKDDIDNEKGIPTGSNKVISSEDSSKEDTSDSKT